MPPCPLAPLPTQLSKIHSAKGLHPIAAATGTNASVPGPADAAATAEPPLLSLWLGDYGGTGLHAILVACQGLRELRVNSAACLDDLSALAALGHLTRLEALELTKCQGVRSLVYMTALTGLTRLSLRGEGGRD